MKIEWTKVSSVTTGGKPHFWNGVIDGHSYCVVWDRGLRQWSLITPKQVLALNWHTAKQAMSAASEYHAQNFQAEPAIS